MASTVDRGGSSSEHVGVLLVHGLCGGPAEMRYLANALMREGYRVSCPLLAGHGGTSETLKASRWQDWLASAEQGLDDLRQTCDTVVVGGLSTGALLALLLARRHPDKVHGLALYSPTFWVNGLKVPWALRLAGKFLAFPWLARHFEFPAPQDYGIKDERIREFLSRGRLPQGSAPLSMRTPALVALERRGLVRKALQALPVVAQPTLIIHPREDCLADIDNAFYVQRHLAGTSSLVVLDDSYHIITLDRQRGLVAEETRGFVGRVAASVRRSSSGVPAARTRPAVA
jgi:carboxylesterase